MLVDGAPKRNITRCLVASSGIAEARAVRAQRGEADWTHARRSAGAGRRRRTGLARPYCAHLLVGGLSDVGHPVRNPVAVGGVIGRIDDPVEVETVS